VIGAYERHRSREVECFAEAFEDAGALVESLVRRGISLADLEVRPLTLEEALVARRARR